MGNLDDYNRRTWARNFGAPVTPASNAMEVAADMAHQARRGQQAGRSAGTVEREPVTHTFTQLLVVLACSVVVLVAGLVAAGYLLPDDLVFLGALLALAGAIFGLFAIYYLLKKSAGVFFVWLFSSIGRLFRSRG